MTTTIADHVRDFIKGLDIAIDIRGETCVIDYVSVDDYRHTVELSSRDADKHVENLEDQIDELTGDIQRLTAERDALEETIEQLKGEIALYDLLRTDD